MSHPNMYSTKLVFMFNSKHSLQIELEIKIKMSRKRTIKQREIDDKISMTLDNINKLLLLNIILARLHYFYQQSDTDRM